MKLKLKFVTYLVMLIFILLHFIGLSIFYESVPSSLVGRQAGTL